MIRLSYQELMDGRPISSDLLRGIFPVLTKDQTWVPTLDGGGYVLELHETCDFFFPSTPNTYLSEDV